MARVQTVLGDITPETLGPTYHHEHVLSSPPARVAEKDPDLVLDSVDAIVAEIDEFKTLGGNTICDASAIDYGRNIEGLVEVARRVDVHIIATAGFNKGLFFDSWVEDTPVEDLHERLVREITEGIDGTGHRAGQLKFGTSYGRMTPVEEKTARAACRAQLDTHAPLFTHTESGTLALEQLALMKEEGVDTSRVCIGHLDRNPDLWMIRQVARSGAFVSIDQISKVKYYTDQVRIDLIIELVRLGLQQHILVSGDLARRSYLRAYGGGPGFAYILGGFIPRLREEMAERGLSATTIDSVVEDLTINNPRQYFTFWD
jgi:phosphotriesterase-related protein